MGDGDDRLALHRAFQSGLDQRLHLGIEGGSRLVQHKDRRVLQKGAGQGDPLPLTTRQLDTPFAQKRFISGVSLEVRQPDNELMGLCLKGGFDDLGICGVGFAVADVVAGGPVEHGGFLRDHANLAAQAFLGDAA